MNDRQFDSLVRKIRQNSTQEQRERYAENEPPMILSLFTNDGPDDEPDPHRPANRQLVAA